MHALGRTFLPASLALLLAAAAAPAAVVPFVPQGWLGVTLNAPDGGPLSVEEVMSGGPAEKAGVKPGDVVVSWNGSKVANLEDLRAFLEKTSAGDEGQLGLRRGEEELVVRVKLGDRDKAMREMEESGESVEPAIEERETEERPGQPEVEIRPAHKPGGAFLGVRLEESEGKVTISSTVEGSPAARIGISAGEAILSIDGKAMESAQQVVETVQAKKAGDRIEVKTTKQEGESTSEYTYVFNLGTAPAVAQPVEPETSTPEAVPPTVARPRNTLRTPAGGMAPPATVPGTPHPEAQAMHQELAQLRAELAGLRAEMAAMKAMLREIAAAVKR